MLEADDGATEVVWTRTQRLSSHLIQTFPSKPLAQLTSWRLNIINQRSPGSQEEESASGCVIPPLAERPRQHLQ